MIFPLPLKRSGSSHDISKELLKIYVHLLEVYGPQHWWPGESRLEVIIGAILTQNTVWTNVEKVIANLKREKLLSLRALNEARERPLAMLLRSSGYFNQKAKKIKSFVSHVYLHYNGSLKTMSQVETHAMRKDLLSIYGIGPETADSILLYAFEKPIFVVDAYTKRVFSRHGFFEENRSYHDVQTFFMRHLPNDVGLFNEFHALIVRTGKYFCRRTPLCEKCPLNDHLNQLVNKTKVYIE